MMLCVVIGTIVGARLLTGASTRWTTVGLGTALTAYALTNLFARPLCVPERAERWLSPIVGIVTGLVTGGTGVFVIPAVPYLQALGLGKDELIQALGLSFTISTVALAIGLTSDGAFHLKSIGASTLAVIPSLIGMWLGISIRGRISTVNFRRWFLCFLILLGIELVTRPLI